MKKRIIKPCLFLVMTILLLVLSQMSFAQVQEFTGKVTYKSFPDYLNKYLRKYAVLALKPQEIAAYVQTRSLKAPFILNLSGEKFSQKIESNDMRGKGCKAVAMTATGAAELSEIFSKNYRGIENDDRSALCISIFILPCSKTDETTLPGNASRQAEQQNPAINKGILSMGTTIPTAGYVLVFCRRVICKESRVALSSSWLDYVFDDKHELVNLDDIEKYVKGNMYLPSIRPAAETEQNGLKKGEIRTLMMQKIEELTLYVNGKENDELENTVEALI